LSGEEKLVNFSGMLGPDLLKRTNVSVLREVLGCNQPRWMRLNTDQIRCNQANVMSHRDPANRISIPTTGKQ
jgi:hypothetical protein